MGGGGGAGTDNITESDTGLLVCVFRMRRTSTVPIQKETS